MITIVKKIYLVFYKIIEDILLVLILVLNIVLKIVRNIKTAVDSFFSTIENLLNLFKRFFVFLPTQVSETTYLLSSKNDNVENYNDKAPPIYKF